VPDLHGVTQSQTSALTTSSKNSMDSQLSIRRCRCVPNACVEVSAKDLVGDSTDTLVTGLIHAYRAILTKYKANRSFVAQTRALAFSPLEYDLVAGFTSTLFDNYMEYKQLIKNVQDMMANPLDYKLRPPAGQDSFIDLKIDTLVAARSAFRVEMNKIVQAVDILSKDPHVLKNSGKLTAEPTDETILNIIKKATRKVSATQKSAFWDYKKLEDPVTEAPPGRYQWVYVETADKVASRPDQQAVASPQTEKAAWPVRAWVEDNATMLDEKVQPTAIDGNAGDRWRQAWITQLQEDKTGAPAAGKGEVGEADVPGTWEWAWVETGFPGSKPSQDASPAVSNASSSNASNAVNTPDSTASQGSRTERSTPAATPTAKGPESSSTQVAERSAHPSITPTLDFDMMVRTLDSPPCVSKHH
jgi:hypothetical protein